GGGGSADSLPQGNADTGGFSHERSQKELSAPEQVKAAPVYLFAGEVPKGRGVGHIGQPVPFPFQEAFRLHNMVSITFFPASFRLLQHVHGFPSFFPRIFSHSVSISHFPIRRSRM